MNSWIRTRNSWIWTRTFEFQLVLLSFQLVTRNSPILTRVLPYHTKNGFRVPSIFKISIKICKKNFEYCLFLFYIFLFENLKNKNQCKSLNLVTATSNKLYFLSFHEGFKCNANRQESWTFGIRFTFLHVWECMG